MNVKNFVILFTLKLKYILVGVWCKIRRKKNKIIRRKEGPPYCVKNDRVITGFWLYQIFT